MSGGRRIIDRADFYPSFEMVDRLAELAHELQIYCYLPVGESGCFIIVKVPNIIDGYSYVNTNRVYFLSFFNYEQACQ